MAYDTKKLEKKAVKLIKERNLVFHSDVIALLPCVEKTYYEKKLQESQDIKKELEKNKIEDKINLREEFKKSKKPALKLTYYKLISTPEEREKISMKRFELTGKGGEPIQVDFGKDSPEGKF